MTDFHAVFQDYSLVNHEMKLLKRDVVGSGAHRSGWPCVMNALRAMSSDSGMLLDDFADASFSYRPLRQPFGEPWVGIFHHPVKIMSPLFSDADLAIRKIVGHFHWSASLKFLRGAIALCEEVAADLRDWLRVPVITIPHPTETNIPRWCPERAFATRRLVQAGFCLRNTRAIFQTAPHGWHRVRLYGDSPWYRLRDEKILALRIRPEVERQRVEELGRIPNTEYDELLAESVLVTELFGAAANNLVIECIVRGTPILVNHLPAIEEYLGVDYPLYYTDLTDIESHLTQDHLFSAHKHLVQQSARLPSFQEFADRVAQFVDGEQVSQVS